eukprot:2459248-Alexandrium_andersonii.AAC.1
MCIRDRVSPRRRPRVRGRPTSDHPQAAGRPAQSRLQQGWSQDGSASVFHVDPCTSLGDFGGLGGPGGLPGPGQPPAPRRLAWQPPPAL